MTNFLKDVEYRYLSKGGYSVAGNGFTEWEPVNRIDRVFPEGTVFRVTPYTEYEISTDEGVQEKFRNKDKALSSVARLVTDGHEVTIQGNVYVPDVKLRLVENKVEFRTRSTNKAGTVVTHGDWYNFYTFSLEYGYAQEIELRQRPDFQYKVTTIDDVISGEVSFDDVDKLTQYLDNRIRTNGMDFSVRRVPYGR